MTDHLHWSYMLPHDFEQDLTGLTLATFFVAFLDLSFRRFKGLASLRRLLGFNHLLAWSGNLRCLLLWSSVDNADEHAYHWVHAA